MLVAATNAHTLLGGWHTGDAGVGDQIMFAARPRGEPLTCAGELDGGTLVAVCGVRAMPSCCEE